jgi:hypothetical protein
MTETKETEKNTGSAGLPARLRVQGGLPPPTSDLPLTREHAVEIAREAALRHGGDHGYTPRCAEAAAVWRPHAWVVEAILTAASRGTPGLDPRIGRLCRPYQDSDRIAPVVAVEPGGMLRVREPHWTPAHEDFRVHDDVLWFDDLAAARALETGLPAPQNGGAR